MKRARWRSTSPSNTHSTGPSRPLLARWPKRCRCAPPAPVSQSLAVARNSGYPTEHDDVVAVWSMRYHGLLPDSSIGARYALHDGALTPAWLNIIDARLAETCGPTHGLAAAGVSAETIGGLTFLRAGELPTLADAHGDRRDVAPYQAPVFRGTCTSKASTTRCLSAGWLASRTRDTRSPYHHGLTSCRW